MLSEASTEEPLSADDARRAKCDVRHGGDR
jgi:hypothetical protein